MNSKRVDGADRPPSSGGQEKRARGRPFEAGTSGNPAGRPPVTPESLAARRLLEEAMRRALRDGGDAAAEAVRQFQQRIPAAMKMLDRVDAGEELNESEKFYISVVLNRALGREQQSIELRTPDGPAVLIVTNAKLRDAAQRVLDQPPRVIDHDDSIALKRRDLI